MLEIREFDDSQIVLLRQFEGGTELVATLTGENRENNARVLASAFDLVNAANRLVREIDALDGVATMPYPNAMLLVEAADAVRDALGRPRKRKIINRQTSAPTRE